MAKERDFIDYANTAANAVQVAQLNSINSKMQQMAGAMAEKEYREQQEAAVSRCEDTLREAVFFYVEKLRDIEAIPGQTPSEIYIRVNYLRGTYEKMPEFKTSGFRQYEDKERLSGIQRAYEKVIRETGQKMDAEELDQCNRCVQHIFDRDDLLRTIVNAQEREALAQKHADFPAWKVEQENKLQTLTAELKGALPKWYKANKVIRIIGCVVLVIVMACFFGAFCFWGDRFWDDSFVVVHKSLTAFGVLSFLMLVIAETIRYHSKHTRREEELKMNIAEVKRILETRAGELSSRADFFAAKAAPLCAKFGANSSEGYQKLLAERDELLELKLGTFVGEYTKRTLPPGSDQNGLFDLNVIDVPRNKRGKVMQLVCKIKPMGIFDAKGFVERTPATLLSTAKVEAERVAAQLENAGAVVEVVPACGLK